MRAEVAVGVRDCVRHAEPNVPDGIDVDASLVESGLLDSVAVFNLVHELEVEFGIEILDEELDVANFETIARITSLVESKLRVAP